MKNKLMKTLPLFLAGALQIAPFARSMIPTITQGLLPSSGGIILRWVIGGVALLGFDAISSASSISVSPPNATVGQPFIGTVTYSGGHAGDVRSMSYTNFCLGTSLSIGNGLSIIYNGGNTATLSGTPVSATNFPISLKMLDGSNCSGAQNTDNRSTTLVIGTTGGGGVIPSFAVQPQSGVAQVGSDALLSAAASGNPPPVYYWKQGLTPIPGATNSSLPFPNVQLTSAGLYTVTASNASGTASATAYLSVCVTPGSNQLTLNYTNYYPVSNAVTMYSYFTNAPAGSNVYKWQYNNVDITSYSTNGNTLTLTSNQVTAARSGIYGVVFNGTVGTNVVVNQQLYYSMWTFGSAPFLKSPPASTNVPAGSNVLFSAAATVATTPQPYGVNQPLHFDWYRFGTNLLSSHDGVGTNQTSTLQLNNVSAANAGDYTVVVTNFWGSITSSVATLTVGSSAVPPGISVQPAGKSVLIGQNASFSVTATGDAPLSYQWWKGATSLTNGGEFSGATSNILTINGAQLGDVGSYSVVVTNTAGSTNSNPAALAVSAPPQLTLIQSGNSLVLGASTIPGLNYVELVASNLTDPIIWTPVLTNAVPLSGQVQVTNAIGNLQQFFRLTFP
jgi:hypothetical protein